MSNNKITDIIEIAKSVNSMSYYQIKKRVGELESLHEIGGLDFEELAEFNMLCIKILTMAE